MTFVDEVAARFHRLSRYCRLYPLGCGRYAAGTFDRFAVFLCNQPEMQLCIVEVSVKRTLLA